MVVMVIIAICIFRTTEKPFKSEQSAAAKEQDSISHAEKLYQTAVKYNKPSSLQHLSYKKTISCCEEIIRRYPDSPQAEKAEELLNGIPKRYYRQDNEVALANPDSSKTQVPEESQNSRAMRHQQLYNATGEILVNI